MVKCALCKRVVHPLDFTYHAQFHSLGWWGKLKLWLKGG